MLEEFESPSVCGISSESGVYVVAVFNHETKKTMVAYIGSSVNMARRVYSKGHPFQKLNDFFDFPFLVHVREIRTKDFISVEKAMIKKYKPAFNQR